MPQPIPLSVRTVLQNRYEILSILGQGGMGRVYQAMDNRLGIFVAVKELFLDDPEFRSAFKREVKLLANLAHPSLPKSTDYFDEGGRSYFVMELVEGHSLSASIREGQPCNQLRLLRIADQILEALEYLHEQGVVHRDIKPLNIKVDDSGRCRLIDFGIAKGAVGDATTLSTSTIAAATKNYSPLEQLIKSDSEVLQLLMLEYPQKAETLFRTRTDPRVDIYALGATLYHAFTRRLPPPAHIRALSKWTSKDDAVYENALSDFSEAKGIFELVERAMRIDCDERFESANEMRASVRELLTQNLARGATGEPLDSLDVDYRSGRIDFYTYAQRKYPPRHSDHKDTIHTETSEQNTESERVTALFAEQVRRAEILGFLDLLEDLKKESVVPTRESVERLEKLINVEIKISSEIEERDIQQKWREAREKELSRKRAWDFAIRENLRVEALGEAYEREIRRKRFIWIVAAAVL